MGADSVWELPEPLLLDILRRVARGEDPDLLLLELEANVDHDDREEDD